MIAVQDAISLARPARNLVPAGELFRRTNYVTLKVTYGCNLRCTYCNAETIPAGGRVPLMTIERFRKIVDTVAESSMMPMLGLEFHGGEPMLLSDEFLEQAVEYAREKVRAAPVPKTQLRFTTQTNGTLLTDRRLELLQRLGICVGLSLDGPPAINQVYRQGTAGTVEAIRRLRKHGMSFGLLMVLSRANWDKMPEVMDYFSGEGVRSFRINIVQPQGRGVGLDILLSGRQLLGAKTDIFWHMMRNRCRVLEADVLNTVKKFIAGRVGDPPLSCWSSECQAARTYFAIDLRGDIHACGTDLTHWKIGNIDEPVDWDHYEELLRRLHHKDAWYVRCFDCAAKKICAFSCATTNHNSTEYREHECDFTKRFWDFLNEHAAEARELYEMAAPAMRWPPLSYCDDLRRRGTVADGSAPPSAVYQLSALPPRVRPAAAGASLGAGGAS